MAKKPSKHPIIHAYDKDTNEIRSIKEVKNGDACNCICSSCKQPLRARHGKILAHSFAHKPGSETAYCSESALHLSGKALFASTGIVTLVTENKKIPVVNKEVIRNIKEVSISDKTDLKIINKTIEKTITGYGIRADAEIECLLPNGMKEVIAIEILVTHKVGAEKLEKYIKRDITCIEINLSDAYSKFNQIQNDETLLDFESFLLGYVNDPQNMEVLNYSTSMQKYIREKHIDEGFELLTYSESQINRYNEYLKSISDSYIRILEDAVFFNKEKMKNDHHSLGSPYFIVNSASYNNERVDLEIKHDYFDRIIMIPSIIFGESKKYNIEKIENEFKESKVIIFISSNNHMFPLINRSPDGNIVSNKLTDIYQLQKNILQNEIETTIKNAESIIESIKFDEIKEDIITELKSLTRYYNIYMLEGEINSAVESLASAKIKTEYLPELKKYKNKVVDLENKIKNSNLRRYIDFIESEFLSNNEAYKKGGVEGYIAATKEMIIESYNMSRHVYTEKEKTEIIRRSIYREFSSLFNYKNKIFNIFNINEKLAILKYEVAPRVLINEINEFLKDLYGLNFFDEDSQYITACIDKFDLFAYENNLKKLNEEIKKLIDRKEVDSSIKPVEINIAKEILNKICYLTTKHTVECRLRDIKKASSL